MLERSEDPLHPENVEVIFEGRPEKAYVSILDYLALYERSVETRERTETLERLLVQLSARINKGADPAEIRQMIVEFTEMSDTVSRP